MMAVTCSAMFPPLLIRGLSDLYDRPNRQHVTSRPRVSAAVGRRLSFAQEDEGKQVEADVGGGYRGQFGVIVGGGDLDDVGADHVAAGQAAQDAEQFPGGEAARLGGYGARC